MPSESPRQLLVTFFVAVKNTFNAVNCAKVIKKKKKKKHPKIMTEDSGSYVSEQPGCRFSQNIFNMNTWIQKVT